MLIAISTILLYLNIYTVIGLFTSIKTVEDVIITALPYFIVMSPLDCWQGYLSGPIKALGIQGVVAPLTFVVYWVINLPMCWVLVFNLNFGFSGLWLSMSISVVLLIIVLHVLIASTDWHEVAEKAKEARDLQKAISGRNIKEDEI